MAHTNNYPKLHNAAWPGVVGKGSPDAEPFIDLDTMLDLTAKAQVDGVRFDGVDLFLFAPHVDIDSTDDDLKKLAGKVRARNLVIGSVGARPYGVVRIDSASGPNDWYADPEGNQKKIAATFRRACDVAADHGERLA